MGDKCKKVCQFYQLVNPDCRYFDSSRLKIFHYWRGWLSGNSLIAPDTGDRFAASFCAHCWHMRDLPCKMLRLQSRRLSQMPPKIVAVISEDKDHVLRVKAACHARYP